MENCFKLHQLLNFYRNNYWFTVDGWLSGIFMTTLGTKLFSSQYRYQLEYSNHWCKIKKKTSKQKLQNVMKTCQTKQILSRHCEAHCYMYNITSTRKFPWVWDVRIYYRQLIYRSYGTFIPLREILTSKEEKLYLTQENQIQNGLQCS